MVLESGEAKDERRRRSYSQYESYATCGERFRLERVAKAPQRPAAWLVQGIAAHESIEFWERNGREDSPEQMVKWYEDAWARESARLLEVEPDVTKWLVAGRKGPEKDFEDRFHTGRDQVTSYRAYALSGAKKWKVLEYFEGEYAVEVPFDVTFGTVRVVGYIDQLIEWHDGRITVRDLKMGTKKPATALQLGVYAIAVAELLGIDPPEWGEFYMAKDVSTSGWKDLRPFTRELLTELFEDMNRGAEAGIFPVSVGDHCRICSVADFCRLQGSRASEYPYKREER